MAAARRPWVALALACLLLAGCSFFGAGGSEGEPTLAEQGEELAGELSADQLLGQRILLSFEGTELPPLVAEGLREGRTPGVVLFERNFSSPAQLRDLTNQIQKAAAHGPVGLPALIMADQEGGPVRRFPGPPELSAQAMGDTLTAEEIAEEGRLTGELLAGLGVNTDLAPVADVGVPGGALEGEGRAFASDPDLVSDAAGAFAEGLHSVGVAATAKHFPGFGSAEVNTDIEPASIERTAGEEARELAPFRDLVDGGVPLVMLSTAIYPEYGAAPAALAPSVTHDLLRDELSFEGVTVTDALDTPALAAYATPDEVAVEALEAPVDLLLYAHSTQASLDALAAGEGAADTRILDKAALRSAAARVLALRLGLEDAASLGALVGENGD